MIMRVYAYKSIRESNTSTRYEDQTPSAIIPEMSRSTEALLLPNSTSRDPQSSGHIHEEDMICLHSHRLKVMNQTLLSSTIWSGRQHSCYFLLL